MDNYLLQLIWLAALFGMRKPEFNKLSRKDFYEVWALLDHPAFPLTSNF